MGQNTMTKKIMAISLDSELIERLKNVVKKSQEANLGRSFRNKSDLCEMAIIKEVEEWEKRLEQL